MNESDKGTESTGNSRIVLPCCRASLVVRIYSESDRVCIGNASVIVSGATDLEGTTAKENGIVSFASIPAGQYKLRVNLDDTCAKNYKAPLSAITFQLDHTEAKTVMVPIIRTAPQVQAVLNTKSLPAAQAVVVSKPVPDARSEIHPSGASSNGESRES